MSLYDLEIDLSSNDGGVERSSFQDWMRVRMYGNSKPRKVNIPTLVGSIYFVNDGGDEVSLRRGAALPVVVGRGEVVHIMLDGTPNGMRAVGR